MEIANLRRIDWGSLGINFVMVFSPGVLEAAPQTQIATVRVDPEAEDGLEQAIAAAAELGGDEYLAHRFSLCVVHATRVNFDQAQVVGRCESQRCRLAGLLL